MISENFGKKKTFISQRTDPYMRVKDILIFFNWDSLHARLKNHYRAQSYKKKKHKKITAYMISVQKEPTVKRCLLILDLKPLRL